MEEISWEIFRGRLLDPAHTRETRSFVAWNVFQKDGDTLASEPLLAVKLDAAIGQIHVVRALLCHVWASADAASNVIECREQLKWVRELVGTIAIASIANDEELREELQILLVAAVRGTSRLPLNSVEAPLPAFSLGQLAYFGTEARRSLSGSVFPGRAWERGGVQSWQELLDVEPFPLEILLRSLKPEEAPEAAARWIEQSSVPGSAWDRTDFEAPPRGSGETAAAFSARQSLSGSAFPGGAWERGVVANLRRMFNNVSLSPYTSLVDTTLAFVKALADLGALTAADEVDLWSWLLRQLGRHLTAYDLITFHFRGANYPDALLLNSVLKRYIQLLDAHRDLFHGDDQGRIRRRALRQACLLRRYYEGHPVPDAPTSPGENTRVLPPPHVRVPDEQLLNILRRKKRIYADEPLLELLTATTHAVLAESIRDLAHEREWRELGTAVFIDRPFGWGKAVGEPDLTPLLSYEVYSPSIARRRFKELDRLAQELSLESIDWQRAATHQNLQVPGLAAAQLAEPARPVVSLADAKRVAPDFVIVRTLDQGLAELFQVLDLASLRAVTPFPMATEKTLLVRLADDSKTLTWFDGNMRKRLEMVADPTGGFVTKHGTEMPAAGMRVTGIWDENGANLFGGDIRVSVTWIV